MLMELKLAIKIVLQAVQQNVNRLAVMDALEVVRVLVLVNAVGNAQIIVVEVVAIVVRIIVICGAVIVADKVVRVAVQIAVKMVVKGAQNALLVVRPLVPALVLEVARKLVPKPVPMLVEEAAQG